MKVNLDFLEKLILTPSPTGFEHEIQRVVREYVSAFAHSVSVDAHGNLIACLNPQGTPRVMIAGHCDQLGFMVKRITKDGFLYVTALGG
ncbi:MAG: M42 family peptidase, partial [Deltaproteobacteria bacterium]|nr:M42 family peptidase [Deltaproteobacteria bacterium]